jgi:uncharacterized membrane protein
MIEWLDTVMMNVPLLNKFYGAVKQVNEAFAGNRNSFQTVVLVEFPGPGSFSVGFITSESQTGILQQTGRNLVSVFIPTTPNPTSGFLILMPEHKVTKLDMSVADGLKYIVSLGAIVPEVAAEVMQNQGCVSEDGKQRNARPSMPSHPRHPPHSPCP